MIIGIDGNEANVTEHVGVSVYTLKLLEYFAKEAHKDTSFIVYLRQQPNDALPQEHEYFRYKVVTGPFLWSQIFLPLHLYINKSERPDVFFAPAHYAPRFCPIPIIVTIHDLSFFYYPDEFLQKDLYQLKNWTEYSVKQAKKIIAVSKTTKKDIVKFYGLPERSVEIVYNGFEKKKTAEKKEDVLRKYSLQKQQYILYVGTIQPRKNITALIKAFTEYKKTQSDFKLILVGKMGWLYDKIFAEAQKANVHDDIIFTGYESDNNVSQLYNNAFCYVLPSFYEGFGIPMLEAMAEDCPVIASHASSLPEIGSEACLYFDPEDYTDLLEKLDQLTDNTELRTTMIKRGKERIKQFSWETCANETLNVICK